MVIAPGLTQLVTTTLNKLQLHICLPASRLLQEGVGAIGVACEGFLAS